MLSSYCYSFRGAKFFARDAGGIPLIAIGGGLVNSKVTRFILQSRLFLPVERGWKGISLRFGRIHPSP